MQEQNLILIAYKGKILLACIDSPFENTVWSLIGDKGKWSNSAMDSVINTVKNVTKLNSLAIKRVSLSNTDSNYVFYTKLTDKNVNSIVRRTGIRLEFYRIEEVEKLNLSETTGTIVSKFKNEITHLLNDY